MFEHLLTPLFQHLGESVPPFLSVKVDQDLDIETLKISKHQRVPPLKMRKIFVSDFTQILCVEPLDHKDFKFWISSKSETKIFFSIGGTLWCFSDFQSLNFLKNIKGSFGKKNFVSDFDETQNLKSLWPRDFTHEIWAESETKFFLT